MDTWKNIEGFLKEITENFTGMITVSDLENNCAIASNILITSWDVFGMFANWLSEC